MPIPKPHSEEKVDEFISRCMGDDVMNAEFPKQEQRAAICYSTWRRDKKDAIDEEEKGCRRRKKELEEEEKGGPGSGNFGHVGRPGMVGGSGGSNNTPGSFHVRSDDENERSEYLGPIAYRVGEYHLRKEIPKDVLKKYEKDKEMISYILMSDDDLKMRKRKITDYRDHLDQTDPEYKEVSRSIDKIDEAVGVKLHIGFSSP